MDPLFVNMAMIFVRVTSLFTIFPIFSARNIPATLRVALSAVVAVVIAPNVPSWHPSSLDFFRLTGCFFLEVTTGVALGFISRLMFYGLEIAGSLISTEIGLSMTPGMNPATQEQEAIPSTLLYYLAACLWFSMDLHHWLFLAVERSYNFLPIGGVSIAEVSVVDVLGGTSRIFLIGLQVAAPILAVSFIINLVFAVLGRAVPQMNVFAESFAVRILAGLTVLGLTCQMMAQQIANYLGRIPEDIAHLAKLLGAH